MRISNDETYEELNSISLFLTEPEALQLKGYLEQFLKKPKDKGLHFHLTSEDYQKEVTICIYSPDNLEMLDPRAKKLIRKDN